MPNFDSAKIMALNPENYRNELSRDQIKFLYKLKLVLLNNDSDLESKRCERFIDDFVHYLYDKAGMDDGIDLIMRPCNLYLNIGNESFAAIADMEGRRGAEITWILCEDKHLKTSTYKHGDIQLASGLIAAFQLNYNFLEEIYPERIIGIKVVASSFYFYSMQMNTSYINQLFEGLPNTDIQVLKYPKDGMRIDDPIARKEIFICLSIIRKHALALENRKYC